MGWERRGNRTYYYTARRIGGKVVKEYVPGLVAAAAALIDEERRVLREAAAAEWRRARAELDALDALLAPLDALTDALARAALVAAGFRQHNRGEWRRRRDQA